MGLEIWFNPDLLKANEYDIITFTNDDEQQEEIDIITLKKCFNEYNFLFSFLDQIDNQFFHYSYKEYKTLPNKMIECYKLYKQTKNQKELENIKNAK